MPWLHSPPLEGPQRLRKYSIQSNNEVKPSSNGTYTLHKRTQLAGRHVYLTLTSRHFDKFQGMKNTP